MSDAPNYSSPYRVLCVTDKCDLPESELFAGLYRAGVDIEVICNPQGRNYDRLKQAGLKLHEIALKGRFDKTGIAFIRQILIKGKFDILYCFNNRAASNALMASKGLDIKAMTYRGVTGNVSYYYPTSWMTHLHPRVKKIVCVSNSVRSYFLSLRFFGCHMQPDRPVTVYKGHNLEWYKQPPVNLHSEFGIPEQAFVAAFAGRNRPNKGLDYIVDSSHSLPASANVHYLLIGNLQSDKKLRQRIAQSPFSERFHFAGYRNDAPAIIAACDTFIMPSVFKEGFSRAVIEAMAYAVPPIVSNIGGNPELVENQQSGLIVAPKNGTAIADAIMRLYNDPDFKASLGVNAQARIGTTFTADNTVQQTRKIFDQLAKSGIAR
jgi:glycosyltransferase involved in cell wall biosynthesis